MRARAMRALKLLHSAGAFMNPRAPG
jgi:hypothetical protein